MTPGELMPYGVGRLINENFFVTVMDQSFRHDYALVADC